MSVDSKANFLMEPLEMVMSGLNRMEENHLRSSIEFVNEHFPEVVNDARALLEAKREGEEGNPIFAGDDNIVNILSSPYIGSGYPGEDYIKGLVVRYPLGSQHTRLLDEVYSRMLKLEELEKGK